MGAAIPDPRNPLFHRCHRFTVAGPRCVTEGVEFLRQALAEWHVGSREPGANEDRTADALLVAAELLANAQQHGGGAESLELDLDLANSLLWIAVADPEPSSPRPVVPHRPDSIGGHGMFIVGQLATWGCARGDSGKTVWASVPVQPPVDRPGF